MIFFFNLKFISIKTILSLPAVQNPEAGQARRQASVPALRGAPPLEDCDERHKGLAGSPCPLALAKAQTSDSLTVTLSPLARPLGSNSNQRPIGSGRSEDQKETGGATVKVRGLSENKTNLLSQATTVWL